MRISKTWLRPILTAVLFPVGLLFSMWATHSYAQWRTAKFVNVTRKQAVALAWSECFAKSPPGFSAPKWSYPILTDSGWVVFADRTFLSEVFNQAPGTYAWIASERPRILDCRYIAAD